MATHSSILVWRIPWTEEPGELQSTGSPRARHNGMTNTHTYTQKLNYELHIQLGTYNNRSNQAISKWANWGSVIGLGLPVSCTAIIHLPENMELLKHRDQGVSIP